MHLLTPHLRSALLSASKNPSRSHQLVASARQACQRMKSSGAVDGIINSIDHTQMREAPNTIEAINDTIALISGLPDVASILKKDIILDREYTELTQLKEGTYISDLVPNIAVRFSTPVLNQKKPIIMPSGHKYSFHTKAGEDLNFFPKTLVAELDIIENPKPINFLENMLQSYALRSLISGGGQQELLRLNGKKRLELGFYRSAI